jgi:hypothetical protein
MHTVDVQIVRFTDSHFPGWVECILRDAADREWTLADKVPIFTEAPMDATSTYPQPGVIACEIIRTWTDERGRTRCIIDTERPWGVSTKNGETQFEVFIEQITTNAA